MLVGVVVRLIQTLAKLLVKQSVQVHLTKEIISKIPLQNVKQQFMIISRQIFKIFEYEFGLRKTHYNRLAYLAATCPDI